MHPRIQPEDGYGTFGALHKTYDEARPEMPAEIIDTFLAMLPGNPRILDIGCGTGIITRQLYDRGVAVTGSDIDARMIEQAKEHPEMIEYFVAPAEQLPFSDDTFDAVTAFSAFHWFANLEALAEIKRVMRTGGLFLVANRDQKDAVAQGYREIIRSFVGSPLPNQKKEYHPADLLRSAGFNDVTEKEYAVVEQMPVEQLVRYVQSTSFWNLIPETVRPEAIRALTAYFEANAVDDLVPRTSTIRKVVGRHYSLP